MSARYIQSGPFCTSDELLLISKAASLQTFQRLGCGQLPVIEVPLPSNLIKPRPWRLSNRMPTSTPYRYTLFNAPLIVLDMPN